MSGKKMSSGIYLPCSLSTFLAAAVIVSSLVTSISNSSTVPGSLLDWSSFTAAEPFSTERLPRRTWLESLDSN